MDWVTLVGGSEPSFARLDLERDASLEGRFACYHDGCIDCGQACENSMFCGWPELCEYRNEEEEYPLDDLKRGVLYNASALGDPVLARKTHCVHATHC